MSFLSCSCDFHRLFHKSMGDINNTDFFNTVQASGGKQMTRLVCTSSLVPRSPSRLVKNHTGRIKKWRRALSHTGWPPRSAAAIRSRLLIRFFPLRHAQAISGGKNSSARGEHAAALEEKFNSPTILPQGGREGGPWMK